VKRFAFAFLLLGACTEERVIVIPDAGTAMREEDAGSREVDAGPPEEPFTDNECDQQDDCDACMQCSYAPHLACNNLALACEERGDCTSLLACASGCGDDEACLTGCAERYPSGIDLVNEFYSCMICTACPADCRAHYATWCVEPPF
jgi:hypothetical protein